MHSDYYITISSRSIIMSVIGKKLPFGYLTISLI